MKPFRNPPRPRLSAAQQDKLHLQLRTHLGRDLKAQELSFLDKLTDCFDRYRVYHSLNSWDLQGLGFKVPGYSWDGIDVGPERIESLLAFWNVIAAFLEHNRIERPAFMEPVTDMAAPLARMASAKRAKDVEEWNRRLRQQANSPAAPTLDRSKSLELRLVLNPSQPTLESRYSDQPAFMPLKRSGYKQLMEDHASQRLCLGPSSELLWFYFQEMTLGANPTEMDYQDPAVCSGLARILRSELLKDYVVNADRAPLIRHPDPLRWRLVPPEPPSNDYALQLASSNGPIPDGDLIATLPGNPALYLTRTTLYEGPSRQRNHLDALVPTLIPAEAVETTHGIRGLVSQQVELPEHLAARVRILPLSPEIVCALAQPYPGSNQEECFVALQATAPDGSIELWNGTDWHRGKEKAAGAKPLPKGTVCQYDRSALAGVHNLLAPLNLKYCPYRYQLVARITRKFPEVFAAWLQSIPSHIPVRLEGELASFNDPAFQAKVRLDVTETDIDWFDLRVSVESENSELSPEELKMLLDARGAFVRMKGKGWKRLNFELSTEEDEQLARIGLNPHQLSSEPQRLHALQLADDATRGFMPEAQAERIRLRAADLKARVSPGVPASITANLRPYQLDGFHFLAYLSTNHFGGILADDMGLGKTVQTLAWICWLRETDAASNTPSTQPAPSPCLVVSPKSVTDNWRAEAARFAPSLRVRVWHSVDLPAFTTELASADLHVLNYSQLRSLGESLVPIRWLAVVLDEGQYIKNPSSQTAQIARALRATHRLVLSGTPIENQLLDLWSLMAFAMPGILGSRNQFAKVYDAKDDPLARRRLASRVRPFLIRRTKAQVARDLPDRIEEDLYCEIEGDQRTLYLAELKHARQMLLNMKTRQELAEFRFNFLASLMRLRQICCHPALVNPDAKGPGAKMEALFEQIEPLIEEGHKVLVFSQFVQLLEILHIEVARRQWPCFKLTGDTENRGPLIQEFQNAPGAAVFLLSLRAGGFGLNLTSANYVVLFDPWWNPAVENQAIDRTHRIGQTRTVIAYRLLIKNSIEEKIRTLQSQKKELAQDILGEERFAQSLTVEDLNFLLSD